MANSRVQVGDWRGSYLSTGEANSYHTQVLRVGQELGLDHASVEALVVVVVAVGDASLALLVGAGVVVARHGAVFEGRRNHDECAGGVGGTGGLVFLRKVSLFLESSGGGANTKD